MKLPEHPTHEVIDASKMQEFLTCPRKYFFRYVLGWVPEREEGSYHRAFGKALHSAMAFLYKNGLSDENAVKACDIFYSEYRKELPDVEGDDNRAPKTPENGIRAIMQYVERYREEDKRREVLYVEISGNVPVDHRSVYFRIDTILKDKNGVFVLEHKTASRLSRNWADQWLLKPQVGLYTHVLYSLYDPAEVYGVRINGIFLYKSRDPEFVRVPIKSTPVYMMSWLVRTRRLLDDIEREMNEMEKDTVRDIQHSFPQNPESCTRYYGCPYFDLCAVRVNHLRMYEEGTPYGFKVEWWDPRDEDYQKIELKKRKEVDHG